MTFIPYGKQSINQEDINQVVKVLESDFITQGPCIEKFENQIVLYTEANFACAVSNATAALHLSCKALGVGPNDTVWTSPNTFVASANAALYCGAKVDFVDIDSKTFNLDPEALEEKLQKAKLDKSLPKVVIPVHLSGQSCDMEKIHILSKVYGFKIIEDASHSIGASYKGKPVGNCEYSDLTVFSFHPVKIITTGEGGMITGKSEQLINDIKKLRTHGITKDSSLFINQSPGPWYYEMHDLGYNYRMTDIQAALGISQLKRLDSFISARRTIAARYDDAFDNHEFISPPFQNKDSQSSYHLYIIQLKKPYAKRHKELFCALRDKNIGVNLHYIPVHLNPYYLNMGFCEGMFKNAENYAKISISLPMYPNLDKKSQDFVIQSVNEILYQ